MGWTGQPIPLLTILPRTSGSWEAIAIVWLVKARAKKELDYSSRCPVENPMAATPGSEFNLWLGTGAAEKPLSNLISQLAKLSSPPTVRFAPHATLLSSSVIGPSASLEEIKARVKQALQSLTTLRRVVCKFDKVEAGASFFQCVYVKLLKQESEGLLDLHRSLRRAFNDEEDPEGISYFPHMSLVYGDLSQAEKNRIITDLHASKRAVKLENGRDEVIGLTEFQADGIQIVRTVGKSDEWEVVATIPFGQKLAVQ